MDGKLLGTFIIYDEIDVIAHRFALEFASSTIESACITEVVDGEEWSDLSTYDHDFATFSDAFPDEITYLEARGALRRHPVRPNLVRIIEPGITQIGGR